MEKNLKVIEKRLRKLARNQGLRIEKSRIRKVNINKYGGYRLVHFFTYEPFYGHRFELKLEDIEDYLDKRSDSYKRKQKLKHLFYKSLWESHENEKQGKLSSLMRIYKNYECQEALNPFDAFADSRIRKCVDENCGKDSGDYQIRYCENDILGNPPLVRLYLQLIDSKTYNMYEINSYLFGLDSIIQELLSVHPDYYDGPIYK